MNKYLLIFSVLNFAYSGLACDKIIKLNHEYTCEFNTTPDIKLIEKIVLLLESNNKKHNWTFSLPQDYLPKRQFVSNFSSSNIADDPEDLALLLCVISPYIKKILIDVDYRWQTLRVELFFHDSRNPIGITFALEEKV